MLSHYSFRVVFMITLFVASIVTTYYTYTNSVSSKIESLQRNELARVKQRMHELQGTINDLIRKGELDSIQLEISRLSSDASLNYIYIINRDLVVDYSSNFADIGKNISEINFEYLDSYIQYYEKDKFGFTKRDHDHGKIHIDSVYPLNDLSVRVMKRHDISEPLLLSSFDLSEREKEVVYEVQSDVLFSSSGYLLLIFFVASVLYFNVKARTDKIIYATRSYAKGNYGERIHLRGNDELSKIADSVDNMAHHIEEQYSVLKHSQQQSQRYLDIAKVLIIVVDINGKISLLNKESLRVLGREEELLGTKFSDLIYFSEDRKQMYAIEEDLLAGKYKDGHTIEFALGEEEQVNRIVSWSFASIVEYDGVVGYIASGVDISKQKAASEELFKLAHYDSLTHLINRRYLLQRLDELLKELKESESLTLLFIDLDRFKVINDTMGHHVGDELLQVISARLKNILKEEDIIARLGGDEFVVLLTNSIPEDELEVIIERILTNLSQSMILKGNSIYTTASIGVSIAPLHAMEANKLLQYADIAMYEAKAIGKNTYAIYESYNENEMLERLSLQNDLSSAVENGEIKIHYQAQYNSRDNVITGYEALARWEHPSKGFIRPDIFIPIAEESGSMLELGHYILKQSCMEFKRFVADEESKKVLAINISAIQFNSKGFIDSLKMAIDESGIGHEELELEITEGILLEDIENKIELLKEIRAMGIQVSIDDFGTGFSSLSYLKKLPINKLKIDQSFIRDILVDSDDKAIVKTIISMAKSLQLKVIAEGVETKEQVEYLAENGCSDIQGYYYAKPLPIESLHP